MLVILKINHVPAGQWALTPPNMAQLLASARVRACPHDVTVIVGYVNLPCGGRSAIRLAITPDLLAALVGSETLHHGTGIILCFYYDE